jgi:CS1 type fimbrial major subunit
MKFNRTFAAAAAVAFALSSSVATAETKTLDVNIEANVAVDGLLISPVAGWDNNTQTMSWDHALQQLTPINRQITMRNTTGAINAHLVAPARLTDGVNGVDLEVKVNGVPLTTTAAPVVSAGDAATIRNVDFNVVATAPTTWISGNYAGTVYLMFEGAVTR